MPKVSKGMWQVWPDSILNWAVESFKAEVVDDSLRVVCPTRAINGRGDTLNNPTLTTTVSSPSADVLQITTYHYKGAASNTRGPHFPLYPHGVPSRSDQLTTSATADTLALTTRTVSATIDTRPKSMAISFRDGSGRLLTQLGWRSIGHVQFASSAGHPNSYLEDPDKGERWMTYQLQLGVGEKVYGLGERFGPFLKNGQIVDIWNEDGGTSSEMGYKNVPFYITSRGYGVFINSSAHVHYEIQSERTTRVNITLPGEKIDMFIVYGPTPKAIIEKYAVLTGKPALVPAWTFGLWLTTSFTTNYDEKTVTRFLDGMKEREIPLKVFHFDCFWMKGFQWCDFEFDADMFPDVKAQIARMKKDRGMKICVWINSYIGQESKLFDVGQEKGYFIKKADGSVWQFDSWQAGMGFVDFTNPKAWKWYQSELEKLIDIGVDCFKTDFGERIPTGNTVYHDGSDPEKMHNFYTYLYNKCTFEVLERRLGKNEAVLFSRSATAGVQQFPVHWGGDPMSTFEAMAETLRGGLSLGLCGFGYWAHDIGGFEGTPSPNLFKRWIQFGLLSSHSRLHGSGSFRVPWLVDPSEEASKIMKRFTNLKLRLMPYLFAQALHANDTGIPMMRATFLEFPEDTLAWAACDRQYMLGPDLLVAPVFDEAGEVEYWLPGEAGEWAALLKKGERKKGPAMYQETHGFDTLPLMLRPGGVIVMGSQDTDPVYDWTKEIEIYVNPPTKVGKWERRNIVIAESERPGTIAAILCVKGDEKGLEIEVVEGALNGTWKVLVAGKKILGPEATGFLEGWKGFEVDDGTHIQVLYDTSDEP